MSGGTDQPVSEPDDALAEKDLERVSGGVPNIGISDIAIIEVSASTIENNGGKIKSESK